MSFRWGDSYCHLKLEKSADGNGSGAGAYCWILGLDLPHAGGRQDQRRHKRQRPCALQPERAQLLREQRPLPKHVPLARDPLPRRQIHRTEFSDLINPTLRRRPLLLVITFGWSGWSRAGVEADGPFHDQEHLVAALAALEDGLGAREGGLAQARGYEAQALVVEPLPRFPPPMYFTRENLANELWASLY